MPSILAIDLGTSAAKAALVAESGEILGSAHEVLAIDHPRPGWAEQPVGRWWSAVRAATTRLWQQPHLDPADVEAVVFSCQMLGLVPIDAEGEALCPCLLWMDTRSKDQARRMTAGFPKVAGYGLPRLLRWLWFSNGAPNLAGRDPASKMVWLREERPELWERTATLMDVKDWLLFRSTGRRVTTYDCASVGWLLDTRKGRQAWSQHLLSLVGVPRGLLPELVSSSEIVGELLPGPASDLGVRVGLPVVAGAGDANACAVGAGAMDDGQVHLYLGTSAWLAAHRANRGVHPFAAMATICGSQPDRYLLIAEQQTAGASLDWAMSRMAPAGTSYDAVNELVEGTPPGAAGALFFPWFAGERAPVDKHEIRAGFVNLSIEHQRGHLFRALYEGVAFNARWALPPMTRLLPRRPEVLRLVGGGAQSDVWCQVAADAFGLPVERAEQPQFAGVRGVGLMAALALGKLTDLREAAELVAVDRVFEPRPGLRALYDERFEAWKGFYGATLGWYGRLNG